jgi:hypothetical protein
LISPVVFEVINHTIADSEQQDIAKGEAAQPKICPHCGTTVRSRFLAVRIVHAVDKCDRKLTGVAGTARHPLLRHD